MIKLIIFDVGGVLHDIGTDIIGQINADIKNELGLRDNELDPFLKKYMGNLRTGQITEEEFWQLATQELNVRKVKVNEKLFSKVLNNVAIHDEVFEYIDQLKNKGYRVVALSNTINPHSKNLLERNIYKPFGHAYLSYEIGHVKPDKAAYRYVLDAEHTKPDQALFIDDSEENVQAAREMGIISVTYIDPIQLKNAVNKILNK